MTDFSNPRLPQEEINVVNARPLADFAILAAGTMALAAVALLVLMLFAQTIARSLPFSTEQALAQRFFVPDPASAPVQEELRRIAAGLLAPQGLPDGVTITVHYLPKPVANAAASLGGNIII